MSDFTVFISYSHEDGRAFAERLSGLIRSVFSDINVFWDKELIAGDYFWDKLLEEVRHSDVFLYLVSDSSTRMPSGCIRELDSAFFYHKHVIPCILPTYSGDPKKIPVTRKLDRLLYVDLHNNIEHCTDELAKLYGAIYESILNASPITQFHRKEMMLLYEILGKVSDETDGSEAGWEVYQNGYEFEYHKYPSIEGRVSGAVCLEVIHVLSMMESLQDAWKEFGETEKTLLQEVAGDSVEYLVNNIGFWANEEIDHLSYMRFLNERGKFTNLSYADDDGNSHISNVQRYRAMLQEYSQIKHDESNDFFRGRYQLSVDEVIQILQAQRYVLSHPL